MTKELATTKEELKRDIKVAQKKLKLLKQAEAERLESDQTDLDLELYVREREIATYITQYRYALAELVRYFS